MPVATVSRIELSLLVEDGLARPVPSTLRHEPSRPFAVHLVMTVGEQVIEWTFARDLLTEGLERPAGLGDVRIHPATDADGAAIVLLELCSPDGQAVLEAPADELASFLNTTYESVPIGSETHHLDVDAALAALLAGC